MNITRNTYRGTVALLMSVLSVGCGPSILLVQPDPRPQPESDSIAFFDPCPESPTEYPEQLVCINGEELYALYYAPPRSFLSPLKPGRYVTTDARQCRFEVIEGCDVETE